MSSVGRLIEAPGALTARAAVGMGGRRAGLALITAAPPGLYPQAQTAVGLRGRARKIVLDPVRESVTQEDSCFIPDRSSHLSLPWPGRACLSTCGKRMHTAASLVEVHRWEAEFQRCFSPRKARGETHLVPARGLLLSAVGIPRSAQ